MSFRPLLAVVVAFMAVDNVLAEDYSMCRDEGCGDCPVTLASLGTGFPDCIIYNTEDVFGGQDFPPSEIDGVVKYAFHQKSCGKLDLEKTFMVQTCCGACDCSNAGIPNLPGCSAKFGALGGGGGSGALRLQRNGTLITPAYEGPADSLAGTVTTPEAEPSTPPRSLAHLTTRKKGACAGDWKPGPNPGDGDYIRPADGPSVVATEVDGGKEGTEITITSSRTQSWTTTKEKSIGIADVLSLGLSFSKSFEESITDTTSYSFTVPKGEKGYVIFTAYLRCSSGSGTCNGEKVEGEFCTPYKQANGQMAGETSLVIEG